MQEYNMSAKKNIALVAHDNRKQDMIEWVDWNSDILFVHDLVYTGTIGRLIEETLEIKLIKNHHNLYFFQ